MLKVALAALPALFAHGTAAAESGPGYHRVDSLDAPAALWDYASVDPEARRLYVGRVGGALSVDLDADALTPVLLPSKLVHGVAPLPHGLAAATLVEGYVSVFDGASGRLGPWEAQQRVANGAGSCVSQLSGSPRPPPAH